MELGDQMLVAVDPRQNNGSDVAVGVVVAVKEADDDNDERVNLRVLLDAEETLWMTNVTVSDGPADDEKQEVEVGEDDQGEKQTRPETASEAKVRKRVAWPA